MVNSTVAPKDKYWPTFNELVASMAKIAYDAPRFRSAGC